ncbi:hypothetical protein [Amycolatopsis sp. GM8]|uniref:hypothetical protein n=1 Tax=Amycolatopsis sp. GM8 TaxID=2896530 RepID=UPI001F1F91CC|nr:hypothetical protein [Amycolatopsis sp. GM8]
MYDKVHPAGTGVKLGQPDRGDHTEAATPIRAASASPQEPRLASLLGTARTVHYFTRPADSVGAIPDGAEWTTKPDILRSGRMVEWCEGPCMAAIRSAISTDECSLGVLQQFRWLHEAPVRTSEVEQVTISVTCTGVIGRRTTWDVVAHDANLVKLGHGSMEFVVTNQDRYQVRHGLTAVRTG